MSNEMISSYMLYFPNREVHLIGSFNQTTYQAKGMNYLFFHVLRKLAKGKPREVSNIDK
ncbi:hypothetical protein [Brevibacillus formosus]|uniref:hypothetical protein n=1 Tax=Brevibacillus formosus TaxID=54913 RepID=UPI0021551E22|nr:hypothetical protein [Brevibacillus formosus]